MYLYGICSRNIKMVYLESFEEARKIKIRCLNCDKIMIVDAFNPGIPICGECEKTRNKNKRR
jgi:hypothetical protein